MSVELSSELPHTVNTEPRQAAGQHSAELLGKCLDITGSGTANGTLVQLSTCNGGANQTWTLRANGTLVNPQSGRCLDDPGGNTTPGAVQLEIYDCNTTDAQVWKLPPEPVVGPGSLCVDVANADPASSTAAGSKSRRPKSRPAKTSRFLVHWAGRRDRKTQAASECPGTGC